MIRQTLIRPLTASDADLMSIIHAQSFPTGWPSSEMQVHIEKDLSLGIGAPLQAFILVQSGADQADILTLATDPAHRRKGYARKLLAKAESALRERGVKVLYLDVSEHNEGAIALYKSCRFQAVGRRPAYYRTAKGRVAAITFSKLLR